MGHTPRKFPYWKIQYYIERNLSWFDVQKKYHNRAEAEKDARKLGKSRVRLMQVEGPGNKRHPLPEIEI